MKAVILAGGFGTRISEESHLKPKPMLEIGGKPILWHIMKTYSHYGFHEFVICCGYKQHVIKEWFANYYLYNSDVTFDFSACNKMKIHNNAAEPWKVTLVDTGLDTMTGGRIKRVQEYIGEEPFLMTYGDGVSDLNILELVKFHRSHGKLATLTAASAGQRFGVLDLASDRRIVSFREKSMDDSSRINAGYMVLEPQVFDYIKDDTTVFEKEPLAALADDGQLMAYLFDGFWQCMDTKREMDQLNALWDSGRAPWKFWDDKIQQKGFFWGGVDRNMERAVVTGATGLIGRWVTAELLKHQIKVYALVRNMVKAVQVFCPHPNLELLEYDFDGELSLRDLVPDGADVFYHFAWSGVSGDKLGDSQSQIDNIARTVRLAEQLGEIGVKKFIGAGSLHEAEFLEEIKSMDAPVRMGVMYKSAKLAAHYMARAVVCRQGIEFYWPVITNTFGAGEHTPRLVNAAIRKLLHGESPQFTAGDQLYDFIYVTDVARAFWLIGEKGVDGRDYVLGSGRCRPLKEFLQCMGSLVNPNVPLQFGSAPFAGVRLPAGCFDTQSLVQDTGFRCEVSFEEGIAYMKQWVIEGERNVPI